PPGQSLATVADYAMLESVARRWASGDAAARAEAVVDLDRISGQRHRGHGSGRLQQILLALGAARLDDQPVLAREALQAVADWPAAQADGSPGSVHAQAARALLALREAAGTGYGTGTGTDLPLL